MWVPDEIFWPDYSRYLTTRQWKRIRWATFKRDGFRCPRCRAAPSRGNWLEAHHKSYHTYKEIKASPVGDLITLCKQCHDAETVHTNQPFVTASQPRRVHWLLALAVFVAGMLAVRGLRLTGVRWRPAHRARRITQLHEEPCKRFGATSRPRAQSAGLSGRLAHP